MGKKRKGRSSFHSSSSLSSSSSWIVADRPPPDPRPQDFPACHPPTEGDVDVDGPSGPRGKRRREKKKKNNNKRVEVPASPENHGNEDGGGGDDDDDDDDDDDGGEEEGVVVTGPDDASAVVETTQRIALSPSSAVDVSHKRTRKKKRRKKDRTSQKTVDEDKGLTPSSVVEAPGGRASSELGGDDVKDGMTMGIRRSGDDDDDDGDDTALSAAGEMHVRLAAPPAANAADFPFEVDPDDHCESPIEAYQDVAALLRTLAIGRRGRDDSGAALPTPSTTPAIYDPYYCNGAVVRNLNQLGFDNVYNRNEDCYDVWSKARSTLSSSPLPPFDVLVTNPPYSSDHVEKLLQFVTSPIVGDRPWFLLMPNWVVKKDYYDRLVLSQGIAPFYVVPRKRYVYLPPPQYRTAKASDTHKKSSPFVSMWYVWGGTELRTDALLQECYRNQRVVAPTCDVARSKSALRDLRRKKR